MDNEAKERFVRTTEGFYDTALNREMPELAEIVPRLRPVAKEPRCAEGPCVKTMLDAPAHLVYALESSF